MDVADVRSTRAPPATARAPEGALDGHRDGHREGAPVLAVSGRSCGAVSLRGRAALLTFKGEQPSFLRTAEVLAISDDKRSGEFWYWIHESPGRYKPELPLGDRRLTPECTRRRERHDAG